MKKIYALALIIGASLASTAQTMVAHYDFADCSLLDRTSNALDLTLGSSVSPVCTTGVTGVPNTARYFNGNTWYTTANSGKFAMTTWTISALVKFSSFPSAECQVSYVLGSNGAQGSDSHFTLETNDNNYDLTCGISSPNNHQFFGMARNQPPDYTKYPKEVYLDTTHWYCLTASYDGSDMRAYVNGSRIYTMKWDYPLPAYTSNLNPLVLVGTGLGANSQQYNFNGIIDDIEIWNGVRSDSAIMNSCANLKNPLKVNNGKALENHFGVPYPNPASGLLNIPVNSVEGALTLNLYSVDGRLIETQVVKLDGKSPELKLSTVHLASGAYILSISSETERVARHFVKL